MNPEVFKTVMYSRKHVPNIRDDVYFTQSKTLLLNLSKILHYKTSISIHHIHTYFSSFANKADN